jgi:hypothetical protein
VFLSPLSGTARPPARLTRILLLPLLAARWCLLSLYARHAMCVRVRIQLRTWLLLKRLSKVRYGICRTPQAAAPIRNDLCAARLVLKYRLPATRAQPAHTNHKSIALPAYAFCISAFCILHFCISAMRSACARSAFARSAFVHSAIARSAFTGSASLHLCICAFCISPWPGRQPRRRRLPTLLFSVACPALVRLSTIAVVCKLVSTWRVVNDRGRLLILVRLSTTAVVCKLLSTWRVVNDRGRLQTPVRLSTTAVVCQPYSI